MSGYNASPLIMMLTPVLLVIILILILAGMIAASILARRKNHASIDISITLIAISILLWLIVGFGLPARINLMKLAFNSMEISWPLLIDATSWRTSLFVFIVAEVMLLVQRPTLLKAVSGDDRNEVNWLTVPGYMLMIFTTLLAIWSDSFFGLLLCWSGMTSSWLVFLWITNQPLSRTRQLLVIGSPLMFAIALLAIAGIAGSNVSNIAGDGGVLPSSALNWGTLAGLTMLVGVPFVLLFLPLERKISQMDSLVLPVLLSSMAGGFLLSRMAMFEFTSTLFLLIMTGLGLIGFLRAVFLALIRSSDRNQAITLLLLAGMSNVLLITLWGDETAVVAQIGVLSIGIGAFFFLKEYSIINEWASIIPAGAVAGMPLTLGFTGLTGLYYGWLDLAMYSLVLVTTLLYSLYIATVILALRSKRPQPIQEKPHSQQRYIVVVAVILIFLGLFDLPHLDIEGAHIFAWIAILLSTASGILLAWYIESRKVAVDELRGLFRLNLPALPSRSRLDGFYASYISVIKEVVAILEGEGGMLWILVLIIILWLARQG